MTLDRDLAGSRTSVTSPVGSEGSTTTTYDYDPAGRLTSLSNDVFGAASYTYDRAGLLIGEDLPDGQFRRWDRAPATGQVTAYRQVVDNQRLVTALTYDPAGRVQTEITNGSTTTYAYDPAGQLTAVVTGDPGTGDDRQYSYDMVGNRLTETVGHPGDPVNPPNVLSTRAYTYDDANQLDTAATTAGGKGEAWDYTYDSEGRLTNAVLARGGTDSNLTAAGTEDLTIGYGPTGKPDNLAHVTPAGTESLALGHDHDGYLASVTAGSPSIGVTGIVWDTTLPIPQPVATGDLNGAERGHVYGPAGRIASISGAAPDSTVDGSAVYAVYAYDARGNTITTPATTDTALAGAYDPFGNPVGAVNKTTGGQVLFGFHGELTVGPLTHLRNRDYNPATGTFTTTDPLDGVNGTATAANGYHYANNDPVNGSDPLGLRPSDECFRPSPLAGYTIGTPWGSFDRNRADNVILLKPLIAKWAQINGVDPFLVGVTIHHEGGNYLDPWRRGAAQTIDYGKVGVGAVSGGSPSVGIAQVQIGIARETLSSVYCETNLSNFEVATALIESDDFSISIATGNLGELSRTYSSAPDRGLFLAYSASSEANQVLDDFDWDLQDVAQSVAVDIYTGHDGRVSKETIEILLRREKHWVSSSNALREAGW